MCKKPNEKTIKAIEELEQGLGKSVDNIDELFKDLENDIKKAERKGENTMLTSKEEEELREFQLEKLAEDAYSAGHNDGYEKGYEEGYEEGKYEGFDIGYSEGYKQVWKDVYVQKGYDFISVFKSLLIIGKYWFKSKLKRE